MLPYCVKLKAKKNTGSGGGEVNTKAHSFH